jgi:phosphatidylinositol alpha 1,6-mannosyltransferase
MAMPIPQGDREARPLRVAVITGAYNYIRDGVALTLNRLVGYIEDHGVETLVFAPVGPVAAIAHRGTLIPVPSIPAPGRSEYRIALGLSRSARERLAAFRPDIIHIAVPDLLGLHALRYARRHRIPVVCSYHTRYETYLVHYGLGRLRPLLSRYLDWFYSHGRHLYVPSSSMLDLLRHKPLACELRLWTRGVDNALFNPDRRSSAWRRHHGWSDDDFVVVYVGRLVREKRLDVVVQMCERLRARGIPFHMLFVGEGPERRAVETALPAAVITGFLAGEELATAYASSDVFVFPSDSETFGNVTLEAMASGLPTICADASGSRSLVVEGVTGFLVDPERADLFAEHVASLALNASLRHRLGEAGRARSLEFSWDKAMEQILGHYRDLVP